MQDIVIITNFASDYSETDNDRFLYIAKKISNNCNVEIVTSDFCHEKKKHRNVAKHKWPFKITFLNEPGYKKNVSIKRIFSHKKWAKNVEEYLNNREKPDVIYCAVPSLYSSMVAAKYCKKNKVKYIIDVQDIWPEAFKLIFNFPIISNIIFYPMQRIAKYIYSHADSIVAVSKTYLKIAMDANKREKENASVFLGTDMNNFDKNVKENLVTHNDDLFRIAYVGTLGHSYDLKIIIDAIKILNDKGINNIKFVVMGDGPLQEEFKNYANDKKITSEFTGRLEYRKMVGLLASCDVAVNPIVHGAAQSIINKVGDYAMAGLPVISTQECEEYKNLLDSYKAGINCQNDDAQSVANAIEKLMTNKKLYNELKKGSRKLGEELFDRNKSYQSIVDIIYQKKVSVIVPIYNTEKYLKKCIKSITDQDYKNLEIILVNDGSTDSSLQICNELKKQDDRIIVIDKKNSGQAEARNVGIKNSTGYYISFIDSDDYIDKKMISTLVKNMEMYSCDVSVCSLHLTKNENEEECNEKYKIRIINPDEAEYITAKYGYGASVCNKLYKRNIIKNIHFEKSFCNEDGTFNDKVYNKSNKVVFQNSKYYHYLLRNNSTIHGEFKMDEYKSLKKDVEKIKTYKNTKRKKYEKSRLAIKATKIIIGVLSSNHKDNEIIDYCFKTIKTNYRTMIFNKNISCKKKIFVTFCLIFKKAFIKRKKIVVKLCKRMRGKVG